MTPTAWIGLAAFVFATVSAIFGYGFWLGQLERRVRQLEGQER